MLAFWALEVAPVVAGTFGHNLRKPHLCVALGARRLLDDCWIRRCILGLRHHTYSTKAWDTQWGGLKGLADGDFARCWRRESDQNCSHSNPAKLPHMPSDGTIGGLVSCRITNNRQGNAPHLRGANGEMRGIGGWGSLPRLADQFAMVF
jgi:hypothetical protein